MEKKVYEEPSVTKVEFEFNECIAASVQPGFDPMECDSGGDPG